MKLFIQLYFLIGLTILSLPVSAQQEAKNLQPNNELPPEVEKQALPPDVVISEVCYWPTNGEAEWIELANISDKPVDIKGWQLVDGQSLDFVISDKTLVLPPKSYLVVKLDGTEERQINFDQNKAVIHSSRNIKGDLLGDKGGHLALYSVQLDILHPSEIRSYVAWGRSPGRMVVDAAIAKLWSSSSRTVLGTGPDIIMAPIRTIQQGGSIGLVEPVDKWGYAHEHWGIFTPTEVNPGRFETKRGVTISPLNTKNTDNRGYATLNVIFMEDDVKYQFQIFTDKICQTVFLDAVLENGSYFLEKPVPPASTYYWRARLAYPNGTLSDWSAVQSLTNEQLE